jgi:hypothetical protein
MLTLASVRQYLQHQRQVSVTDFCRDFNTDYHTAKPLIARWVRKGMVQETSPTCQQRCVGCGPIPQRYWCWVGDEVVNQ